MRAFLIALAVVATALTPSAEAIVGIYAGTENQTTRESYVGLGGYTRENRLSGRVYFLYEFGTSRSVEIRIHGKQYRVREERVLVDQTFARTQKNGAIYLWVFSGAGKKSPQAGATELFNVSWQGSKTFSVTDGPINPKSGLPSNYPTVLSGRQEFVRNANDDIILSNILTRRATPVSLSAPITKASNDANENFDQALVRLKAKLNATGYTESTSAGDFLN